MAEGEVLPTGPDANEDAIDRAFGALNRNKLIDKYFETSAAEVFNPDEAWRHVYQLLLWPDPTTGLAHCYESDKCQPGKPWYRRSLAFHDWASRALSTSPQDLAKNIDWLFVAACKDLEVTAKRREDRLVAAGSDQRAAYPGFPIPGDDLELVSLMQGLLKPYFQEEPSEDLWRKVAKRVRSYLAVQNKRKNLVGEGFEDVLAQVIKRSCRDHVEQVLPRQLLYELPGFNRAKTGGKENKVDLAIVQPSMRTVVTAKWSVRADREKQFAADYEEYCNAESSGRKFEYVFITNEFDPARLMRACDALFRNNQMFDHVVHINTDAVRAAYGIEKDTSQSSDRSRKRVIDLIESGRLTSLSRWLQMLLERQKI